MTIRTNIPPSPPPRPWQSHITIDLILKVLNKTFLHPWVAWMIPLCLRAQYTPYSHPAFQITFAYACFLTALFIFEVINNRIAYGLPREVDLSEEVIVITGGASGLGLLVAEVYGMRGANVAVLDVKEVKEEHQGVEFYKCDVGDRAQVERAAKRIEKDLGTPTILINNAGIVNGKPLLELSAAEVEKTFRANLLSHFNTTQTFLPCMLREGRGTIVTVASVLGSIGVANLSDYCASKAALISYHSSLRAELAQSPDEAAKNIKTVLISPGQLSTPLFAKVQTPCNFFAPVVEPNELAKEIINVIDSGESADLAFPLYARWIQWLHVLPVGMQRIVRSLSRADKAMAALNGRPAKKM